MTTDSERGWQTDPDDPSRERWWDGSALTALSRSKSGPEDRAVAPPPVAATTPPPVGDPAAFDRAPWPAAATALGATVDSPAVGAATPAPVAPPSSPERSKWKVPVLLVAVLLLALISGVIAYSAGRSDSSTATGPTRATEDSEQPTDQPTTDQATTEKADKQEKEATSAPSTKKIAPPSSAEVKIIPAPTVQKLPPPATSATPGLSALPASVPSDVVRNLPMESWVTILQSGLLDAATTMSDVTQAESRASGAGYDAGMLYTNDYASLRQNVLAAYVGPFSSCVEARVMAETLISAGIGFTSDSTYQRKISGDPAYQNPEMTKC